MAYSHDAHFNINLDEEASRTYVKLDPHATITDRGLGNLTLLELRAQWPAFTTAQRRQIHLNDRTLQLAWPDAIRASDNDLRLARNTPDASARYPYAFCRDNYRKNGEAFRSGKPRTRYYYLWQDLAPLHHKPRDDVKASTSPPETKPVVPANVQTQSGWVAVNQHPAPNSPAPSSALDTTALHIAQDSTVAASLPPDDDYDHRVSCSATDSLGDELEGPVSSRIRGLSPNVVPSIETSRPPITPLRNTSRSAGRRKRAVSPVVAIERRKHPDQDEKEDTPLISLRASDLQAELNVSAETADDEDSASSDPSPIKIKRAATAPVYRRKKHTKIVLTGDDKDDCRGQALASSSFKGKKNSVDPYEDVDVYAVIDSSIDFLGQSFNAPDTSQPIFEATGRVGKHDADHDANSNRVADGPISPKQQQPIDHNTAESPRRSTSTNASESTVRLAHSKKLRKILSRAEARCARNNTRSELPTLSRKQLKKRTRELRSLGENEPTLRLGEQNDKVYERARNLLKDELATSDKVCS